MRQGLISRFLRQQYGATIVEFAVVAPVFFLLILGILEFGLYMFHKVAIESITMQAGREASLNKANSPGPCAGTTTRVQYIECYVQNKSQSLIRGDDTVIEVNTLAAGGTFVPDICMDNPNKPSSKPTTCTVWQEENMAGGYQGAAASNGGTFGDLVEVRVLYPWKVLVPFLGNLFNGKDSMGGDTGVVLVTATTVIKNEPF